MTDDTFTLELPTVHKSQVPMVERRQSQLASVENLVEFQPSMLRRLSDRRDSPITTSVQTSPQRPNSSQKVATEISPESSTATLAPAAQLEQPLQTAETDFQIHEDPFMEGIVTTASTTSEAQAPQQSQEARSVLSEVPVNEFSQNSVIDNCIRDAVPMAEDSPPQSPQSKAETLRSRKLLMSGIERIRGRTLDAHGFRKVLELIRSSESGEIFGSVGEGRRFDDLCNVLLEYIIEASDSAANPSVRHTQELRRQATSVMRTVLNAPQQPYRKWIASGRWYPRTLTGAFEARKNVEGSGLLVKDLEALASDIVSKVHPEEGEKAIIEWLEREVAEEGQHSHEQGLDGAMVATGTGQGEANFTCKNKAMALALRNLAALLASTTATAAPLSREIGDRAGRLTVVCLRSKDAEVRKASVELATQLHASWPVSSEAQDDSKSEFWGMLEKSGLQESARNLIVYFIARKEKSG